MILLGQAKAKEAENIDKRKYNLFVKLLEIMREGAETGVEAMSEAVEQNSENVFAREAMMRFKGREGAFSEVLELLEDEEYFYAMIGNYSIRG